ncbi:hypothetical protein R2362_15275 [Mycobacteroides chelonae]|nr:hypothetical protein [Mycobacteroides chelonae]
MALCAGRRRPGPKRPQRSAVVAAALTLVLAVMLAAALGCVGAGHLAPPAAHGPAALAAMNMPPGISQDTVADTAKGVSPGISADISPGVSSGVSVARAGVYQHAGRADDDAACSAARLPCAQVCPADVALAWDTPTTAAPPSMTLTYPVWAMGSPPAPPRPAARAPGAAH